MVWVASPRSDRGFIDGDAEDWNERVDGNVSRALIVKAFKHEIGSARGDLLGLSGNALFRREVSPAVPAPS
jgi:hypothetical protein